MPKFSTKNVRRRVGPGRNQLLKAQHSRGKRGNNIWMHFSARNRRDVVLRSDSELDHFIWLEGDESIVRYVLEPDPYIEDVDGVPTRTQFDARVYPRVGWTQLREVKESADSLDAREKTQRAAQLQAAARAGMEYVLITRVEISQHEQLISNWLRALAYLAASRDIVLEPRCEEVLVQLSHREPISLRQALNGFAPGLRSVYTAALFKTIQDGRVRSDMDSKPLCVNSRFWLRTDN